MFPDETDNYKLRALSSSTSVGGVNDGLLAWTRRQREFDTGGLFGPWDSRDKIPYKDFRLVQRLVIHEQRGGQESAARCIETILLGGHILFCATTAAHRPCDLDTWVSPCRVVGSRYPRYFKPLSAITSAFKTTRRQVTGGPVGLTSLFLQCGVILRPRSSLVFVYMVRCCSFPPSYGAVRW